MSRISRILILSMAFLGLCGYGQPPECPQLQLPTDGASNVSIATHLEWTFSTTASGYVLTVGTSPGANNIVNTLDLGDVTRYDFLDNLPLFQEIYVTITPYDAVGTRAVCSELTFTTGGSSVPLCTEIINPGDGHDLVSTTANITWIRDFSATGYLMTIFERDPDGIRILENFDVGNGTNFKPPDFKPRTRYFVTIIPYNESGPALGCRAITFTTGDGPLLPECTVLVSPANGATGVSTDAILEWASVTGVDGYLLSVGTSTGSTDILNHEDVGNTTQYSFMQALPVGRRIYVWLTPFSGMVKAENCAVVSFTVEGTSSEALEALIQRFFTPNNDGVHDNWTVLTTPEIEVQRITIFDRYGKLLTELAPGEHWDGTLHGRPLPSNTYWFAVELANSPTYQGALLLKR